MKQKEKAALCVCRSTVAQLKKIEICCALTADRCGTSDPSRSAHDNTLDLRRDAATLQLLVNDAYWDAARAGMHAQVHAHATGEWGVIRVGGGEVKKWRGAGPEISRLQI